MDVYAHLDDIARKLDVVSDRLYAVTTELASTNATLRELARDVQRMDTTLWGEDGASGVTARLTRLEAHEARRRYSQTALWSVVSGVLLYLATSLVKLTPHP
jgi:hypothetical protein